jgi:hypothetical protein
MEGMKKMEIDGKYRKCIILMVDKGKAQVLMVNKEFAPTRITQKKAKENPKQCVNLIGLKCQKLNEEKY